MLLVFLGATQGVSAQVVAPRGGSILDKLAAMTVPRYRELSVSPDGRYLFYMEDAQNDRLMWLHDIASGEKRRLLAGDEVANVLVGNFRPRWSDDGQTVAMLRLENGLASVLVWRTAADAPPDVVTLERFSAEFLRESTGPTIYNDPRSGVPTRSIQRVGLHSWEWMPDRNLVVFAIAWGETSPDDLNRKPGQSDADSFVLKSELIEERERRFAGLPSSSTSSLRIFLVDLTSKAWTELDMEAPAYGGTGSRPNAYMARSGDGQVVFLVASEKPWSSWQEANSKRALFVIDPVGETVTHVYSGGLIYNMARSRTGRGDLWAIQNAAVRHTDFYEVRTISPLDGESVVVISGEFPADRIHLQQHVHAADRPNVIYQHVGSYPEMRLYETNLESRERHLISPADMSVTSYSASADGKTLVAVLENVTTPPSMYLWRPAERVWNILAPEVVNPMGLGIGQVERISWRSKDDRFDVEGFVVKPPDFDAMRQYPLLVFLHGGPGPGVANTFDPMFGVGGIPAHVFAAEGYLVFVPNFRGDTPLREGVAFTQATDTENAGEPEYMYDIDAGVDHLIEKKWVNPAQLGILGHSHGTTQMTYAITNTTRYKVAVANDAHGGLPQLSPLLDCGTSISAPPAARFESWISRMGYHLVDPPIRTPILLRVAWYSSKADRYNCQLMNADYLYSLLKWKGIPIDIVLDEDAHSLHDPEIIRQYQDLLLRWFDHFILGKGPSPVKVH